MFFGFRFSRDWGGGSLFRVWCYLRHYMDIVFDPSCCRRVGYVFRRFRSEGTSMTLETLRVFALVPALRKGSYHVPFFVWCPKPLEL